MTRDAIYRATKEKLSHHGVIPTRSAAMLLIYSLSRSATPPEIGRYLLRKRNSVRGLLTRMEGAGLIRRYQVPHKKKLNRYELTEKGRKLYHKTTQLRTIEQIFPSLSKVRGRNWSYYCVN